MNRISSILMAVVFSMSLAGCGVGEQLPGGDEGVATDGLASVKPLPVPSRSTHASKLGDPAKVTSTPPVKHGPSCGEERLLGNGNDCAAGARYLNAAESVCAGERTKLGRISYELPCRGGFEAAVFICCK